MSQEPPSSSSPPPPEASKRRKKRQALIEGCRSVEEFERLDRIDEGSYGVVYRARDKVSRDIVALKRVKLPREACLEGFPITALRETNVLLALQHENIIRVHEMVVGREHDRVFVVMDYFEHDLKTCIEKQEGPFSQADAKSLVRQLVAGVSHMHSKWFIHRDIKTSNLLYSRGRLALCDFGLARRFGDPVLPYTRNVVTLWYRAPELLLGATTYSTELDAWSCGCVFAEIFQKAPLFQAKTEIAQLSEIFKVLGIPTEERWPGYQKLPFAKNLAWKKGQFRRNRLRDLLPAVTFASTTPLSDSGFEMLGSLLALDPARRGAPDPAHPYFAESPLPSPPHLMPRFPLDRI
ncbi:hypothetical protein CTAYLR_003797 [Chrysophaeum taylorii]|uniref:Cyclin-dependent kinase 2 homolog n=1 Tax=Chrysophaeum taylorii TaxID=2483200 RepID=A0AAD7UCY8_9STRA|nr:hypothetical protein CTAYLR_003797 [Chrysophaeum taylorii]